MKHIFNESKHAATSVIKGSIFKAPGGVCMEITDNVKGFAADRLACPKARQRLGMLGMRERVGIGRRSLYHGFLGRVWNDHPDADPGPEKQDTPVAFRISEADGIF